MNDSTLDKVNSRVHSPNSQTNKSNTPKNITEYSLMSSSMQDEIIELRRDVLIKTAIQEKLDVKVLE